MQAMQCFTRCSQSQDSVHRVSANAYWQRLPADEERAASARRRMALRLLVELLCLGVSQDVAGVLGVLQGLVRAPAIPRGFRRGASRPPAGRWSAAAAPVPHAV